HHERLEELQGHLLGQTTLVQLQLRANDDDRTAGGVNTLAEEGLAETTLLALEHVAQGLQGTVARTRNGAATTTVVEEAVNSFLKHALFVVDDDLRSTEVKQSLESVVAVDHTTVEVVEVRGREAATVQLDHRAQFRRDHRDGVQNHAERAVVGGQECVDNLQALQGTRLALALAVLDGVAQGLGLSLHVKGLKTLLDRLGTHGAFEVHAVAVTQFAVQALVALKVSDLEVLEAVPDLLKALDIGVGTLADVRHLAVCGVAGLLLVGSLGAFTFKTGKLVFKVAGDRGDVAVAAVHQLLLLEVVLDLEVRQFSVAVFRVNAGDHVGSEVDDLLKVLRSQVQEVAQARGNALEVPDVGYGRSQFDVAHALTTHLGAGDFNATTLTDDALEADALVLAAVAFPVAGRTEDLLAEKTVL